MTTSAPFAPDTQRVVDGIRRRGVSLSVVDGRIVVRPATAIRDDEAAFLRARRDEVIALLTPRPDPHARRCATARLR